MRVVKCCNMKEQKGHRVVHTDIHMNCLGFLYLVTSHGLSVVLPSVSIALFPYIATRYSPPCDFASCNFDSRSILATCKPNELLRPWQIAVLDRVLIFDGPREAQHVCLENGWDLREACFCQM
ncbi:uncharacterized protein LOC141845071 [Curcuma longa]|uniref:uncharacterized protein LOC141845071 n=1 Tax=Curcuma longa TaxID=136217 RepID=UPI003D9E96DE